MKPPKFTDEEEMVFRYYKSRMDAPASEILWLDLSYMLPAGLFAILGVVYGNVWLAVVGLLVVMGFKLRENIIAWKWTRLLGSVLHKFDAAVNRPLSEDSNPATPPSSLEPS